MSVIFEKKYELLAEQFQKEQVQMLKRLLAKHGVPVDKAKAICGEFTFDLSMYFDQGEINIGPETFRPTVAFTADEEVFYVQTSDIDYHEYAFGTVADAYEQG